MGSTLECLNLKTGALRTALNYSAATDSVLVATGNPFTPGFGSSIQYQNGILMAPFAVTNIPGGYYGALPASVDTLSGAGSLVWANQTYGFTEQPDEMLLYSPSGGADASDFQVIGAITFADGENEPYTKHLFRYSSLNSASAADWFVNVSTPIGGFFVGVAATIDQANGLYHFVSTDTQKATIFSVDLKTLKSTSAESDDYGPEMTSLAWNSKDGKIYAVAQTDVTTVEVLTVDPKTGVAQPIAVLDLSTNDGMNFQDPAAFNFDQNWVSLIVQYGGSGGTAGSSAGCATQAVYTYDMKSGAAVSNADVKMPAGLECVWTPVTQDFAHTF